MGRDWKMLPWATQAVGKNGQSKVGIKTHMGCNQEADDAEFGVISWALETDTGTSHYLYRRAGSHQTDGIRRAWPRPEVRASGGDAHHCTTER